MAEPQADGDIELVPSRAWGDLARREREQVLQRPEPQLQPAQAVLDREAGWDVGWDPEAGWEAVLDREAGWDREAG